MVLICKTLIVSDVEAPFPLYLLVDLTRQSFLLKGCAYSAYEMQEPMGQQDAGDTGQNRAGGTGKLQGGVSPALVSDSFGKSVLLHCSGTRVRTLCT